MLNDYHNIEAYLKAGTPQSCDDMGTISKSFPRFDVICNTSCHVAITDIFVSDDKRAKKRLHGDRATLKLISPLEKTEVIFSRVSYFNTPNSNGK